MVQHNAARFITNAHSKKGNFKIFSISKILGNLKMETLEHRRNKARLSMAYKIINGHVMLKSSMLPKEHRESVIFQKLE